MTRHDGTGIGDMPTDEAILAELVDLMGPEMFAEAFATFTVDLEGSQEAIRSAIAAGDAESVRRQSHRIKGLMSQFGATGVAAIAHGVEIAPAEAIFGEAARLVALVPPTIEEMRRISDVILSRA